MRVLQRQPRVRTQASRRRGSLAAALVGLAIGAAACKKDADTSASDAKSLDNLARAAEHLTSPRALDASCSILDTNRAQGWAR